MENMTAKPTKILNIIADFKKGGIQAEVMYPARILDRSEAVFDVMLLSDTEGYYLTGCGARTHYAHRRESVNPYRKAFDKDFYQTGGYKIIYEYNETGYTVKSYDLHNGSLLCGYSVEDNEN